MAWNQSTGPTKVEPKKPSAMKGVVAGVVCVAIAAAVAFFVLSGKDEKPKAKVEKDAGLIKEVKPVKAAKVPKSVEKAKSDVVASKGETPVIQPASNLSEVVGVSVTTNLKNTTVFGKSPFAHATDQVIAMSLSGSGDLPPPPVPLPATSDAEFRKSLDTPIEILETDSERTREMKEKVLAAREEIKQRMDNGESFASILAEYRKDELENYATRRNAMIELKEIISSGDVEGAKKYVSTVNLCFQQMGIKELKMPGKALKGKGRQAVNNQPANNSKGPAANE